MNIYTDFRRFLILPFLLLLAACSVNLLPQTDFFDDEVMESFESVLEHVSNKDVSAILDMSLTEFQNIENIEVEIEKILSYAGEAKNSELIIAEHRYADNSLVAKKVFYAAYEYKNGENYDVLEIALQKENEECCFLRHINIKKNEFQSSTYHNFKSHKYDAKRIGFIGLMIGTLMFILVTLIRVIRDKNLNRKWLWFIFVIFGFYGMTLNWTTGQISSNFMSMNPNGGFKFSIVKFNLLGSSFTRSGLFYPWILDWGFPLGAVIYSIKRRKKDKPSSPF